MKCREIKYVHDDNVMIYNQFDVIYDQNVHMIEVQENCSWRVPVYIKDKEAQIGIWLVDIPQSVLEEVIHFIFKKYKVYVIRYRNSINQIGEYEEKNQWTIELPKNENGMWENVSAKGRYNLKRELRSISNLGKISFENYQTDIPEQIVNLYFNFKKKLMNTDYSLSAADYIKKFHVTDAYVLSIDDECVAMLFSCEQGDCVYLENLSYKPEYSIYSCGTLLYVYFLCTLIKKGKRKLYLGDGKQEYKKRFGSKESIVYTGCVYKSPIAKWWYHNIWRRFA